MDYRDALYHTTLFLHKSMHLFGRDFLDLKKKKERKFI